MHPSTDVHRSTIASRAPGRLVRVFAMAAILAAANHAAAQVQIRQVTGNGIYDPVTVEITGPELNVSSGPNPFADYQLDVVFSNAGREWTAPGYFAACSDAADRPCMAGRLWKAHFIPPRDGEWTYRVVFRTGPDIVATAAAGDPVEGIDGKAGRFAVSRTARNEIRARGLLQYVGEPLNRWSGSGRVYFKMGPDSPENTLAYDGFVNTPNGPPPAALESVALNIQGDGLRKSWSPHARDYDPKTAQSFLWENGQKGRELLGAFKYLHDAGVNTVSMLTFNVGGDDKNVVPQLLRVAPAEYSKLTPSDQWERGVFKDRYDISKLAQWQRALSYADALGLRIHLKLQEMENDAFMDGGRLGRERRIYLREMLARFNWFLAVTWNLGEENLQSAEDLANAARYVDALDPYDRPLTLHTLPWAKEQYRPLLGDGSVLTGFAMQGTADFSLMRREIVKWRAAAQLAGRGMTVGYDEVGGALYGAPLTPPYSTPPPPSGIPEGLSNAPPSSRQDYRRKVMWNALTAGAEGFEVYYGFLGGCGDLDCQDHRSRAEIWRDATVAIDFFNRHVGEEANVMAADDDLTPDPDDYVFASYGRKYVIFAPDDKPRTLKMYGLGGTYAVRWYDALRGGELQVGSLGAVVIPSRPDAVEHRLGMALGSPPAGGSGEWAILVTRLR